MKKRRLTLPMLMATLALASTPASADDGRDFVAAFAAAANAKDKNAWKAFLSPASRACLSGPGGEMLERVFTSDTREYVSPDSKVWVTPLTARDELIAEGMLSYADRPTHYFQIDLGPPGRSTSSLIRYGRKQGGRWEYVFGCPTAEGMAQAKAAESERAAAMARYRAQAKSLSPAVSAEARRLVAAGDVIGATRAVAKATGSDLTTARGIVRILQGE